MSRQHSRHVVPGSTVICRRSCGAHPLSRMETSREVFCRILMALCSWWCCAISSAKRRDWRLFNSAGTWPGHYRPRYLAGGLAEPRSQYPGSSDGSTTVDVRREAELRGSLLCRPSARFRKNEKRIESWKCHFTEALAHAGGISRSLRREYWKRPGKKLKHTVELCN